MEEHRNITTGITILDSLRFEQVSILPEQKHYTAYRNQEPKQRSSEENILLFHY